MSEENEKNKEKVEKGAQEIFTKLQQDPDLAQKVVEAVDPGRRPSDKTNADWQQFKDRPEGKGKGR